MLDVLMVVCGVLLSLIGFLYIYRGLFAVIGLFRTKKFAPARVLHRYAVVIAARNEEAVIGNLLSSIEKQDYPHEKMTVFVVADNCTDKTAAEARAHGAICYERTDPERRTKGYALRYLFEQIGRDYGIRAFDAYILLDADNLLKSDYISRMNDAFDAGEQIVTSYRNTKNLDDNWISASYALHWLRTARFENRARAYCGISTRIQGTGVLFASALVSGGWNYTSLTEDRAFSADAVVRGVHISYQHEAQFYDEQPVSLGVAWRQRLRWSKGHLQAFAESSDALFSRIFTEKDAKEKFVSYDMLLTNFPSPILSIPLKTAKLALAFFLCLSGVAGGGGELFLAALSALVFEHIANIPVAAALFFLERGRIGPLRLYKKIWYCLTFPLFSVIGDLSICAAAFRKVRWDPIPHCVAVKIEEMETVRCAAKKERFPKKFPETLV